MSNYVELDVFYVHDTDDAVLINEGDRELWIPKALIKYGYDLGYLAKEDNLVIEVLESFAEDNELI